MSPDREFTRKMFQTVLTVAGVALLISVLWAARRALMLIYVSALIAMGFSPLVNLIQHPTTRSGTRRLPRWLAILTIYLAVVLVIVIVGLMVVPPLVAQTEALWTTLPDQFSRFQSFLMRYKLMSQKVTLVEAVQNAPPG